jgi:hypothetical protein
VTAECLDEVDRLDEGRCGSVWHESQAASLVNAPWRRSSAAARRAAIAVSFVQHNDCGVQGSFDRSSQPPSSRCCEDRLKLPRTSRSNRRSALPRPVSCPRGKTVTWCGCGQFIGRARPAFASARSATGRRYRQGSEAANQLRIKTTPRIRQAAPASRSGLAGCC